MTASVIPRETQFLLMRNNILMSHKVNPVHQVETCECMGARVYVHVCAGVYVRMCVCARVRAYGCTCVGVSDHCDISNTYLNASGMYQWYYSR